MYRFIENVLYSTHSPNSNRTSLFQTCSFALKRPNLSLSDTFRETFGVRVRAPEIDLYFCVRERTDFCRIRRLANNRRMNENGNPRKKNEYHAHE